MKKNEIKLGDGRKLIFFSFDKSIDCSDKSSLADVSKETMRKIK
jgi:hypothetical protein